MLRHVTLPDALLRRHGSMRHDAALRARRVLCVSSCASASVIYAAIAAEDIDMHMRVSALSQERLGVWC